MRLRVSAHVHASIWPNAFCFLCYIAHPMLFMLELPLLRYICKDVQ
jgi:hypothetical protein